MMLPVNAQDKVVTAKGATKMNEPKYRPILFTAPMVRAILEGRKIQTRRIVDHVSKYGRITEFKSSDTQGYDWTFRDKRMRWNDLSNDNLLKSCPHGQPGDRLWVRENWRIGAWNENNSEIALDYCDGPRKEWVSVPDPGCDDGELFSRLWKQSTDDAIKAGLLTDDNGNYHWEIGQSPCRLRPSIFMPRWASRITLEITGVRVERLQDISGENCWAEGIECAGWDSEKYGSVTHCYRDLWESIYGPKSWDKNPWVWVVEFKRVES